MSPQPLLRHLHSIIIIAGTISIAESHVGGQLNGSERETKIMLIGDKEPNLRKAHICETLRKMSNCIEANSKDSSRGRTTSN